MRPRTRSSRGRGRGTRPENENVSESVRQSMESLNLGRKSPKKRKVAVGAGDSGEGGHDTREAARPEAGTGSGLGDNMDEESLHFPARTEWSSHDETLLVELWQEEDHLYNKTNKNYRNAVLKNRTLQRIAAELNKDGK